MHKQQLGDELLIVVHTVSCFLVLNLNYVLRRYCRKVVPLEISGALAMMLYQILLVNQGVRGQWQICDIFVLVYQKALATLGQIPLSCISAFTKSHMFSRRLPILSDLWQCILIKHNHLFLPMHDY
jgi:hypothetical protein